MPHRILTTQNNRDNKKYFIYMLNVIGKFYYHVENTGEPRTARLTLEALIVESGRLASIMSPLIGIGCAGISTERLNFCSFCVFMEGFGENADFERLRDTYLAGHCVEWGLRPEITTLSSVLFSCRLPYVLLFEDFGDTLDQITTAH